MNFLTAFLIYILLSVVMSILIGKTLKAAASDNKIFKWIGVDYRVRFDSIDDYEK